MPGVAAIAPTLSSKGKTHRRRPPEIVAEEFGGLQKRGARYVCIVDSVFNSTPAHVAGNVRGHPAAEPRTQMGMFPAAAGVGPGAGAAHGPGRPGARRVWLGQLLRRGPGGLRERLSLRRYPAVQRTGPAGRRSIAAIS